MLFNENNVIFLEKIDTWQEAIVMASKPLLDNKSIEQKYIDKMIENINKLGFYVVLDDYIAMPHSRPEDGVLENCVSFLKLEKAVLFGEEPINLIFVIGAKDSNSHVDMIKKLMEIFKDEIKDKILKVKTKKELLKILQYF
ncbi:PTS sugar transporter subunit IIA [Oceanivirga salmonicida]|uniref:PTS sugar transporter subunit IIA n=1 Tax=Oceanivirga salmonicida TaxID=1769291 RepID=UPI0012E21125|nr:PTS sugar transporter subunit IIA [Oceanivirga salmonicida]